MNTTKKAQHTGGEWILGKAPDCYSIYSQLGNGIAIIPFEYQNAEANARLIASAPLMLEALEAVLNMGDDYEAEKLVLEAIKKARG